MDASTLETRGGKEKESKGEEHYEIAEKLMVGGVE